MSRMSIEQTPRAQWLDVGFYASCVLLLAAWLLTAAAAPLAVGALLAAAGAMAWGLAEYLLHRWVLHALPPFKQWHAAHHARPGALIATPTWLSASLIALLVALPAWAMGGAWHAGAFTLGWVAAYLAYGVIHHACHHGAPSEGSAWVQRHRRWHGHHHRGGGVSHFGVSLRWWDWALGSAVPRGLRPLRSPRHSAPRLAPLPSFVPAQPRPLSPIERSSP